MNPGLVIKLRPTGPWRIGPDSGARNQVDAIYHSDTLYSAVSAAMARLGWFDDWLGATARNGSPAVIFSSCFPFVEEIGFVVPPRTIWPPTSPALLSARVRWKSARFVPLGIVPALLAGQSLDENQWAVDGLSGCLLPAGRSGPFRTGVRFNAAVDRLTGAAERHSVACLEFRPGAGLWALASFADQAAYQHWQDRLKTAFRVLADSGFGGERSRGWGRAETPEFTDGMLPEMILDSRAQSGGAGQEPEAGESPAAEAASAPPEASIPAIDPNGAEPSTEPEHITEPESPAPDTRPPVPDSAGPQWLLSLFTPGAADSIDWDRGNYTVLARGGRIESPFRSGELKKQINMVSEGSVLYAAAALRGSAADVAPDGFEHPVFRVGFAVSIPLPEAS